MLIGGAFFLLDMDMEICRDCSTGLVVGDNWLASKARHGSRICRPCDNAQNKAWREAHRGRDRARKDAWTAANPERMRELGRAWRTANPERQRELGRVWRKANPDRQRELERAWCFANPEKVLAKSARRRALKRAALCPDRDDGKIAAIYSLANRLTRLFGRPYHVDHVVPLAKGGLHHEDNLVVMRGDYNSAKKDTVIPALISFFGGRAA